MGVLFSSIWRFFQTETKEKVIIIGLNNAGKTTTLYKLVMDTVIMTAPTIGSNVEEFTHKNVNFVMWDIGGQESSRVAWSTYYQGTNVIMLLIDSTDRERLDVVGTELNRILAHEHLKNAVLLIYANKQDLAGAMKPAEISEKLHLDAIKDHEWHIQGCCALTGEGLATGLDWIVKKRTATPQ